MYRFLDGEEETFAISKERNSTKHLNQFREVLRNYFTPDTKKFIFWLLGIGAFFGFIWIGDIFPKIRDTGWSAIEYAVVAYSILVARGFGYAIYDSFKEEGALKALGRALSGLIIVAFVFYFLVSSPRGQGVAIVILCSATYGFLAGRRQASPKRHRRANSG